MDSPFDSKLVTLLLSWANMIYHSKLCSAVPRFTFPLSPSHLFSTAYSISLSTRRFVFYCLDHRSRTQLLCSSSSSSSFSSSSSSSSHVQMVVQSVIPAGCSNSNSNSLSNSDTDTDSASASGGRSPSSPPSPRCRQCQCRCLSRVAVQFSIFLWLLLYSLSLFLSRSLSVFFVRRCHSSEAAHHRLIHSVLPP